MTREDKRATMAPFSKEEIAVIRKAIVTPGATLDCPRCGTLLTPERSTATEGKPVIVWLYCASCQRNLIVRDLPEDLDDS